MKAGIFINAGAAMLLFASFASAASYQVTVNSGPVTANGQAAVSIPQFNIAGGTLISIDFTLVGYGSVTYDLTDNGSRSLNYTITAAVTDALENPLCYPACSTFQDLISVQPLSTIAGTLAVGGTTGNQTVVPTSVTGSNNGLTTALLLAAFTGTGNVITGLDTTDGTRASTTPRGVRNTFTETTSGGGIITVTYNYTVAGTVPEPVSMLLFGSGLTALALIGKKKFGRK